MELYERIRELRKNHLHMSQTDFGQRLGVSRSVINNIELNALARPEQKTSLLKLICKEFSVNEEWLIHGVEPMFVEANTFCLDDFVKQRGATDLELEILKIYFELDPNTRKTLLNHFKNRLTSPSSPTQPERHPTAEELEAEYKKTISNSARNTDSTVSNTIDGTGARNVAQTGSA